MNKTGRSPLIIGLTGSIAMGKSTVAAMFEAEGVPVFDADAAVHQLQGPNGLLVTEIEAAFPSTTGAQGVDRQKLGAAVLGNAENLAKLEAIVHPAVGKMRNDFLTANAAKAMIVFDIPLLFEKGGHHDVSHIVVVSAPAELQRSRALVRPGMTTDKFEHILKLQVPDAEKRARANTVIDTGQSIAHTKAQVRSLVKNLRDGLAVSDK